MAQTQKRQKKSSNCLTTFQPQFSENASKWGLLLLKDKQLLKLQVKRALAECVLQETQ